jgi:DNA-binding transcriptional LysR family regulator
LERGKRNWRVPVRGPITTGDIALRRSLALAGVGLVWTLEPLVEDLLASGKLEVVLESYAPIVPGLFLYFPSRSQVSPALRAFVEMARETAAQPKKRVSSRKRS